MTKVTQQQRDNLLAAMEFWKELPAKSVLEGLAHYRCGSAACFGGWLPSIGHFKELGIYADGLGAPSNGKYGAMFLCQELFGVRGLFYGRKTEYSFWENRGVHFTTTDHQLVQDRLDWTLANTEVV